MADLTISVPVGPMLRLHIAFFNHSRTVQRTCGNGTWNMNRLNLTEDYPSRCYIHKEPDMTDLYTVQIIYTVGYSLSLASLTVAMGIIIRFRARDRWHVRTRTRDSQFRVAHSAATPYDPTTVQSRSS
ncbi:Vasoactive intestinal polypeptide receptor [Branchiostoma belcheri]|nr:Vasoactive intestinal polypeptide receptor [Branchiostoma belcheri]